MCDPINPDNIPFERVEHIERIKIWIKHSLYNTSEVSIPGEEISEDQISSIMKDMNLYAYYDKKYRRYYLRSAPYLPKDMAEFYQSYPIMAKAAGREDIKVIT